MARLLLATAVLAAGCALDNQRPDTDGGLDFQVGDIPFRLASGTARVEATGLALYLTDQPDACLAVTQVPVGRATIFTLRVAAQADGTRAATVVARQVVPGPGQAMGGIQALVGGAPTGGYDAGDGSVSWRAEEDGTTTILTLDVGFVEATGRIQGGEWTVPACP